MTNQQKPEDPLKKNFSEEWENLKKNNRLHKLYDYSKQNPKDTIAYILLIFGIIFFFFNLFFGSLLIGVVLGYYYFSEFNFVFQHLNEFIEEQGLVRSIVALAALIVIVFGIPGLVIGTIFSILIRRIAGVDHRS